MKLFCFFIAGLAVVQAALQANNDPAVTAPAPAAAISSFMATQTNSNLAAMAQTVKSVLSSASAVMATAAPTASPTAAGFGSKMKNFFKSLQGRIQKPKSTGVVASAVASATAAAATTAPAS